MADAETLDQRLAGVDLFAGLPQRALRTISERGREVYHEPGHVVATEGESGIAFHLVLEGSADVEVGGDSRPSLTAGDYFGEISMIDNKPRSATVRAGQDGMKTFSLSAWQFSPLLDNHPEIARAMLVNLCARLRAAESRGKAR
jgi:CRP-like cAMP-binding protein